MKKSIFVALCTFALNFADAQTNDFKWRFGINAGATSYSGDLNTDVNYDQFEGVKDFTKTNKEFFKDQSRGMLGVELERRISQRIGLRLGANMGQVAGSDRFEGNNQYARSLNFESNVYDANAVLKLSLLKRRSFINFYLTGGAGVTMFDVYANLKDQNDNYYNYSNPNVSLDDDFETKVSDLDLQKEYDKIVLHIPVGLGIQLKLLPRITASVEVENRFMFSDYLDNVSDVGAGGKTLTDPLALIAYNPNPAYDNEFRGNQDDKLYDSYAVMRVGLSYNFARMKNAAPSKKAVKASKAKVRGNNNSAFDKVKNIAPKINSKKFRAPVFYPSSTPSSLHTQADAQIDGGKAMKAKAKAEALQTIDPITGEVVMQNPTTNIDPQTMAIIDQTLAIIDETVVVVDETLAKQEAIESEIADMETQINNLEADLANQNNTENAALIAEIERLEAEIEAALLQQAEYEAAMDIAQAEAIAQIEAANQEIEAAKANATDEEKLAIDAQTEEVGQATEVLIENTDKKTRKQRREERKKAKAEQAEAEAEAAQAVEEATQVVEAVAAAPDDSIVTEVIVDDTNSGEKNIKIFIDENSGEYTNGDKQMRQEMNQMRQEIERLRTEKQEMQMNQIQSELDDIKNTLNLLLQDRLQNAAPKMDSNASKAGNTETRIEKKIFIIENDKDLQKLMEENPELKEDLKDIEIEKIIDDEKKNEKMNDNRSSSSSNSSSNSSSSTPKSAAASPSKSTTTTTTTTAPQQNTQNTQTTPNNFNFPKDETGRTQYDYSKMQQIASFPVDMKVKAYSNQDPAIKQTLQNIANQVKQNNAVVLIKANTTEFEKDKMRNTVFEINKDLIYNYGLVPQQIDSSMHIAADGVKDVREIYINNALIELLIFKF